MESWLLVLATSSLFTARTITAEMQNEDSCVLAAKDLTSRTGIPIAICINTFDGRVLYFSRGQQRNSL